MPNYVNCACADDAHLEASDGLSVAWGSMIRSFRLVISPSNAVIGQFLIGRQTIRSSQATWISDQLPIICNPLALIYGYCMVLTNPSALVFPQLTARVRHGGSV